MYDNNNNSRNDKDDVMIQVLITTVLVTINKKCTGADPVDDGHY